jgi:hypothetical protein
MAAEERERVHGSRLKRVALAAAMGVVTLNIWTGNPLFAVWVGSKVQGSGPPTMGAIFAVAAVLLVLSLLLLRVLSVLGAAYDKASGAGPTVRTHAPWLRSMRGERELYEGEKPQLTGLERTLVIGVILAAAVFEIWFFFFAGSPLPQ